MIGSLASNRHRLIRLIDLDVLEEVADVVADRADLARRRRIVGEEVVRQGAGADLEREHLADAPVDAAEDDLRRAAADVDHRHLALDGVAKGLGCAEKRQAPLLLLAQHVHRQPGHPRDLSDHVVGVLRLADRCRGDDADRLGLHLLGQPDLGGDDVGELGDLLGNDLPLPLRRLVDPGVGTLLHHLAELALLRLGYEHAGGVRADVDRRAEHQLRGGVGWLIHADLARPRG
jgi:hypothetical protein